MVNVKSAKRRTLASARRAERNKTVKFAAKTTVKKVDAAVAAGGRATVEESFRRIEHALAMAVPKDIPYKNTSSRKVSCLSKFTAAIG